MQNMGGSSSKTIAYVSIYAKDRVYVSQYDHMKDI